VSGNYKFAVRLSAFHGVGAVEVQLFLDLNKSPLMKMSGEVEYNSIHSLPHHSFDVSGEFHNPFVLQPQTELLVLGEPAVG
jgi:hypothetical protein